MLQSVGAACPEGTVALGGGTAVSDPLGIELTSSAPVFGAESLLQTPNGTTGAPTGWDGGAANNSGMAGSVHVAAICAPGVTVTTVVNSTSVVGGTFAGATATCPDGTVAIAGGAALANLSMRLTEMARTSRAPVRSRTRPRARIPHRRAGPRSREIRVPGARP
jgi:hypothetical protein